MNVPVITVFVELTLTIILDYSELASAHNCTIDDSNKNNIIANCSFRNMSFCVPQDLPENIIVLDLSGNTLSNLDNKCAFDRYTSLKTLIMRDLQPWSYRGSQFPFKNLYTLEIIDCTRFLGEDIYIPFEWPPNTKVIYIAENRYLKSPKVDNLKYLEKLYASGLEYLETFPKFHEVASVTVLDLKNSNVNVSAELISKLCHLEHLNITLPENYSYCECRKLKLWMNTYRVKSGSPFICKKSAADARVCNNLKFTPLEREQRRNCLGIGMLLLITNHWFLITLMLSIIVLSLLIPSYVYAKKFRDVKHKLHHPRTGKSYPSTPDMPPDEEVDDENDSQKEDG